LNKNLSFEDPEKLRTLMSSLTTITEGSLSSSTDYFVRFLTHILTIADALSSEDGFAK
jgi:hypothetical protein